MAAEMRTVKCANCKLYNQVPNIQLPPGQQFRCGNCGAFLQGPTPAQVGSSAVLGATGGAMIGGAVGGPPGALLGAIAGFIVGSISEGK